MIFFQYLASVTETGLRPCFLPFPLLVSEYPPLFRALVLRSAFFLVRFFVVIPDDFTSGIVGKPSHSFDRNLTSFLHGTHPTCFSAPRTFLGPPVSRFLTCFRFSSAAATSFLVAKHPSFFFSRLFSAVSIKSLVPLTIFCPVSAH